MTATLRRATIDDASVLADLGRITFIEAFGHLYTPEDLAAFIEDSHSVAAYARVLADIRTTPCGWAEREGEAIGYAQAGPAACRTPRSTGRWRTQAALPAARGAEQRRWRRPAGGRAGLAGARWPAHAVDQRLVGKLRGAALLGRHGFGHVGEYEFIVGEQRDREFIYRRKPAIARKWGQSEVSRELRRWKYVSGKFTLTPFFCPGDVTDRVLLVHGLLNADWWLVPLAARLHKEGFDTGLFGYSSVLHGPERVVPRLVERLARERLHRGGWP